MAPEQVRGEDADHRADIFALGTLLYEMLAGCRAFQRSTPVETMTAILRDEPSPLQAALPPAITKTVHRCLAKDPADQYQSAQEIATELAVLSKTAMMPFEDASDGGAGRVPEASSAVPSIAVLPFEDISPLGDQDVLLQRDGRRAHQRLDQPYGCENALRTSASQFRGQALDIREIGQRLRVGTILEGSVRTAGTRLRITAKLINAGDGYQLWAETASPRHRRRVRRAG